MVTGRLDLLTILAQLQRVPKESRRADFFNKTFINVTD